MLSETISNKVLSVGCQYRNPKGGVAQVMKNYSDFVFTEFKCIINSGGKSKSAKLFRAISGLISLSYKLLSDRQLRIVHIHTASYNSFRRSVWYLKLAKLFRKKVILHIHGGGFREFYDTNPEWISKMLNRSDAIIVLSESWKEYFQNITSGPEIFILENIVANPGDQKQQPSDRLELLFLGLIDKQKGIFDLLDAINEHDNFSGKIRLHIGGNGKIEDLKQYIDLHNLSDIVKYEGFVSGKGKTNLLRDCDAYILPSYTEGLPVSILEAMSFKKPILSTPVGGIPEVVKDGVNGFLFSPGDKNAMASAIIKLLHDNNLTKQMGSESLNIIRSYFPDNVCNKLAAIYNALL